MKAWAGRGRRSAFIERTVERALGDERRWEKIEASLGAVTDDGHEWDRDPAAWVHAGRSPGAGQAPRLSSGPAGRGRSRRS